MSIYNNVRAIVELMVEAPVVEGVVVVVVEVGVYFCVDAGGVA